MMQREIFQIEYLFRNVSKSILWNSISLPNNLSEWFSDSVTEDNGEYVFVWDGHEQRAELLKKVPGEMIRFRWYDDESPKTYFQFSISEVELTGDIALTVIDFASPDELDDAKMLWNKQIEQLSRRFGM